MVRSVFNHPVFNSSVFNNLKKYLTISLVAASVILAAACTPGTSGTTTSGDATPAPITANNNTDFVPATNSVDMAKAMKIGWNLGNTFDAPTETGWSQPKTTRAMIHGIRQAGFVSIRIPVSWHTHITDSTNYTIDSAWMNRVKEVVDWALEEGLCVIINIHHDNLSDAEFKNTYYGFAVSTDSDLQEKSEKYIAGVWKNIATTFKDYDYNLVFEVLNEPRDINGTNWGDEWYVSGTNAKAANGIIGKYEQTGLNAIRQTGSKNADRFVMVPPYAASTGCMEGFSLPTDTAENRLIVEAHAYSPYNFAMASPGDITFTSSHKSELSNMFNNLYNSYVSKGIGVIIDETGATNKNNIDDRIAWAQYFFGEAYKKGIPSFWWDNGVYIINENKSDNEKYSEHYGYYNRNSQVWYFPNLMKASLKAVGVDFDETADTTDTTENPSSEPGTNTDSGDENFTAEDLVILENKTVYTDGNYGSFNLDATVDLTNYRYLKIEIYSPDANNADQRKLFVKCYNSDWKTIGDAGTIGVSDTIYLEIKDPEEGKREVKIIQYAAQNTSTWTDIANVQIEIKKITATNTKN